MCLNAVYGNAASRMSESVPSNGTFAYGGPTQRGAPSYFSKSNSSSMNTSGSRRFSSTSGPAQWVQGLQIQR
jgi:hypothetical protein